MSDTDTKREDQINEREQARFNSRSDVLHRENDDSGYINAGIDQAEAFANDPNQSRDTVKDAENQFRYPGKDATTPDRKEKRNIRLKKLAKRGGPIGLLLTILTVGGISIFGPTTMLVNLVSNLTERYDYQNASLSARSQLVLAKRLAGSDLTKGSCGTVKIACRYSRPSNRLLSSMSENGFTAYDDKGNAIEKRLTGFPNAKPASYTFTDSNGKTSDKISARDLISQTRSNPELRRGLSNAYRARYMGFSDKVAYKIFKKFNVNKTQKLDPGTDEDKAREKLNDESSPSNNDEPDKNNARAITDDVVDKELDKTRKTAEKTKSPVTAAASFACLAKDTPGLVSKIIRTYRLRYLIKYGMVFLSAADDLKAGDATPEQITAIGTILTATTVSAGKVTNKSALDSFGVKYALFGDTSNKGHTSDYRKFIPGGGTTLDSIANKVDNSQIQSGCNKLLSAGGQAAAVGVESGLAAASGGTTAIISAAFRAAAVTGATTVAIEGVFKTAEATGLLSLIKDSIGGLADKIASSLISDWTKDIKGEDVGNALTASVGALDGQIANAGGNMPLTKSQAVAYRGYSEQIVAREAEDDRATMSPLDASNPHTFMGTIATQMLPTYANFASVSGVMTNIMNVPSIFGSVFGGKVSAADNTAKYSMCEDSNVQDNDVAADPFCNIEYGIPAQYLNKDPEDVLNAVSDQIDPDTGEPNDDSDLKDWIDNCGSGELYQSAGCVIEDQTHANYALYITDSRILDGMDNEQEDEKAGDTAGASGGPADFTVAAYNILRETDGKHSSMVCSANGLPNNQTCFDTRVKNLTSVITGKSSLKNNPFDVVMVNENTPKLFNALKASLGSGYDGVQSNEYAVFWNTAKFTKTDSGTAPSNGGGGKLINAPWVGLKTQSGRQVYAMPLHYSSYAKFNGSPAQSKIGANRTLDWLKSKAADKSAVVVTGGDAGYFADDAASVFNASGFTENIGLKAQGKPSTGNVKALGADQMYITPIDGLSVSNYHRPNEDKGSIIVKSSDHAPVYADVKIAGDDTSDTAPGTVAWPMGLQNFKNKRRDYLEAHGTSTGTAWGKDNMGTRNEADGVADDIRGPDGTPVYAMMDGVVTSTNLCSEGDGVAIKSQVNGKILGISYMHGLGQTVKVGQTVKAGQKIMLRDHAGCHVTGPHLHLGIAYDGKYICPQDVFLAMEKNQQPDWAALTRKGVAPCGRV